MSDHDHGHDLAFEKNYWGNCVNTFDEEQKHYVYAKYLGYPVTHYAIDANRASILDIGGGPVSILLKMKNLKRGKVIDPISYPQWTVDRYKAHNVLVNVMHGEQVNEIGWDEVIIYNVLQHVVDPKLVIDNAKRAGKRLRMFEWIDIPPHEGHPHELTKQSLEEMVGVRGHVVELSSNGCYGKAWYVNYET